MCVYLSFSLGHYVRHLDRGLNGVSFLSTILKNRMSFAYMLFISSIYEKKKMRTKRTQKKNEMVIENNKKIKVIQL